MTLESYSTLATKNYNFYAPWNGSCGHLVFVNVCLQLCMCLSISVFVAKKTHFGTLRSRDFIFGILHTQLMKQFQLSGDLDLYTNKAKWNLVAAWKCVSPRIFRYLTKVLIDLGKR